MAKRSFWPLCDRAKYKKLDSLYYSSLADGAKREYILCYGGLKKHIIGESFPNTLDSISQILKNVSDTIKLEHSGDLSIFNFYTTIQGRQKPITNINEIMGEGTRCLGSSDNIPSQSTFPWITFSKNIAIYSFSETCSINCRNNLDHEKIIIYWDTIRVFKDELCYQMLRRNFKAILGPEIGKPFMNISLLNDSTVKASYLYPEWTRKMNSLSEETIFPETFVVR